MTNVNDVEGGSNETPNVTSVLAKLTDAAATPIMAAGFIGLISIVGSTVLSVRDNSTELHQVQKQLGELEEYASNSRKLLFGVSLFETRLSKLEEFRDAGRRWTRDDGIANQNEVKALRRQLNQMVVDFKAHTAWGEEWAKGTRRYIADIERRVKALETRNGD